MAYAFTTLILLVIEIPCTYLSAIFINGSSNLIFRIYFVIVTAYLSFQN